MATEFFDGYFELLPMRSYIDHGEVPKYPTSEQFQTAACAVANADPFTWEGAGLHWRIEAIRYRSANPGAIFDADTLKVIARAVAARIAKAQAAALAA